MILTKVLYISYDGISDPLGRAQVLPYIKGLSRKGAKIFLLSFEKEINRKNEFNGFDISWIPVSYHKGGILVKIWDMASGIWLALWAILKEKIRVIHCRGYFPAFLALCLKAVLPVRYIFDMRGLWIDEKVDSGALRRGGIKYYAGKWLEKGLLISADRIIVLTQAMKRRLEGLPYLEKKAASVVVIPTCVDLELFHPDRGHKKADDALKGKFVISYFGSIGTFYNFSAALDFYKVLSRGMNNTCLLVMSNAPVALTRRMILGRGIPPDKFYLDSVRYEDVPGWLNISDVSLIFYNRKYSKEGCCPTKLGESLACGVPVVINDGIGDCSSIIKERKIGVIIKNFTEDSYAEAAEELLSLLKDREALNKRCRNAAEELFSLNSGVEKYLGIYNSLT